MQLTNFWFLEIPIDVYNSIFLFRDFMEMGCLEIGTHWSILQMVSCVLVHMPISNDSVRVPNDSERGSALTYFSGTSNSPKSSTKNFIRICFLAPISQSKQRKCVLCNNFLIFMPSCRNEPK